jgi:hypothetical protein
LAALKATALRESAPKDANSYYVWHPTEGNAQGVPPGKYLVDDQGQIRWLVDPGINGKLTRRDDGTEAKKFSPPQAELFALITHGILNQKLPWILVVFGVILGTGTGGGLVVRGRVLTGANAIAGEWGHNPLPWPGDDERPGPACYCGRFGCVETFLSGPGLAADVPLFQRNQGGIRRADADVERAALDYAALREQVEREVRESRVRLEAAREALARVRGEILPATRDAVKLAEQAYQAGDTSYLALLEAQRRIHATLLAEAEAAAEARRATAELERSIGTRP